jgi:hypothetical protein
MIHPERKLVDTRDKISFSLPKTLEAKEEQIREQTISISCCCCAFQPPLFSKSMCIASRILSSRANTRPSDRSSVRIEVGFVLFRNEQAKHHHRVHSKKSESFATELQTKKTKKNISRRTANKDIACLRSTVSSLDAKVTFEVRETDFTERCRFKLSVLATDAFALMWMDWTIEAIIIVFICVLL